MPLFDDDSNKRIRYYMKMWGHLDNVFVMISNEMPQFTPIQIFIHWETLLNPQLYHDQKHQTDDKKINSQNYSNLLYSALGKVIPENMEQETNFSYLSSFTHLLHHLFKKLCIIIGHSLGILEFQQTDIFFTMEKYRY